MAITETNQDQFRMAEEKQRKEQKAALKRIQDGGHCHQGSYPSQRR